MIGIKRRKKVEGWAQDVNDLDRGGSSRSLRQRLAENNKLWLVCFLVVLGLSVYFIRDASVSNQVNKEAPLPIADVGSYNPDDYADFAAKFAEDSDYSGILLKTPEFNGPDKLRLLVPGDASRDDIEYVAKMAARLISHKFSHRVVVQVYMKRANGSQTLVAHTMWDSKKGYSVKFKEEAQDLL